ncbi:DUF3995 domain-containing protein [Algoriphagus yeomjeoni]|uniref:Uncharacterized protein DUF3995 n=1 Tax=Algoriphagus yeomjeoni TaxID=291403 RepID=A0A327PFX0_9BACT|nr:DUF3995 domain-containing protein [Algoriphagus yeomjeoni]RAI90012.1 uncharacterized protein DUF3995 [Algoriphagus yeomjeoni]
MKPIVAILLIVIFSVLALIHFYWAIGGQWGFESVLPTNEQGQQMLSPKTLDSIIVGSGLTLFAAFYWLTFISVNRKLPFWVRIIGLWVIPLIFGLRALGDFKYIGFFKQIKSTEFAKSDTWFFSPLCLIIAILGFVLLVKSLRTSDKSKEIIF